MVCFLRKPQVRSPWEIGNCGELGLHSVPAVVSPGAGGLTWSSAPFSANSLLPVAGVGGIPRKVAHKEHGKPATTASRLETAADEPTSRRSGCPSPSPVKSAPCPSPPDRAQGLAHRHSRAVAGIGRFCSDGPARLQPLLPLARKPSTESTFWHSTSTSLNVTHSAQSSLRKLRPHSPAARTARIAEPHGLHLSHRRGCARGSESRVLPAAREGLRASSPWQRDLRSISPSAIRRLRKSLDSSCGNSPFVPTCEDPGLGLSPNWGR
jgi:hypothetical protein